MSAKVGISGYGRIGRIALRIIFERNLPIDVIAFNCTVDPKTAAYLFKYDSVHGTFKGDVDYTEDSLIVNGKAIKLICDRNAENLPWGKLGVDVVLDCTGAYTSKEKAMGHIKAGAKKVVISAPGKNVDLTVSLGVNDELYDKNKHHVISNASCTTTCLAPIAQVLNNTLGIQRGLMTTIHSYTSSQALLDNRNEDFRRSRAANLSMIPTSTGAAKAVGLVLPELNGKLDGLSVRIPVPNVSMIDLTCDVNKATSKEEVNAIMKAAAESERYKNIIQYTEEELVSIDFCGNPYSAIFDSKLTRVMDGNMVKVMAWYDNEWGYSCRTVELVAKIGQDL